MFTIVMQPNKELIITNGVTIYERECNVDVLRFLVPHQYTEGAEVFNLAEYVAVCKIKTVSGKVYTEYMTCEELPYRDRLDYRLKLDATFTAQAGTNTLYLTFLKAVEQDDGTTIPKVLHSGNCHIEVQRKEEFIFIPDESLQAVDVLLLKIDDKMNKLDSMVEEINDEKAEDIEIIDNEIWLTRRDTVTGEIIKLGDPLSAGSHVWETM